MIGRFTTGRSGLGMLEVMGRRRVPSPPAITTAIMSEASSLRDDGLADFTRPDCPALFCRGPSSRHGRAKARGSVGHGDRTDQAADLYHVEHSCPPVQRCT